MPTIDANKLSQLVVASGLLSPQELVTATAELSGTSARRLAAHLVDRNLLTPWQAKHLLNGRYKGFLLDEYKLVELVGTTNVSLRYRAEHTPTGKLVILNIGAKK